MDRKVKLTLVGLGAVSVVIGIAVMTGLSYLASPGDETRWSVRFVEQTRLGKWLDGRITVWALNSHINSFSDAERERFQRDYEELCKEQATTPRKF